MSLIVKIGGARGIGGDALLDDLARSAGERRRLVIVHGGSDATTRLQERLGEPARMVTSPSGHESRVTDRTALEAYAMATALVNRQLVEGLQARGVRAFGISGLDGALVRARRKPSMRALVDGRTRVLRDQWTGRPVGVDGALLDTLLDAGLVPVVAPLAAGAEGEMLNVDGDRIAAALAAGISAESLLILTNVPGLLEDPTREESLVTSVPFAELDSAEALARGRMRRKLLGAREALEGGVGRVILGDARRAHAVTDALAGAGTTLSGPAPSPTPAPADDVAPDDAQHANRLRAFTSGPLTPRRRIRS